LHKKEEGLINTSYNHIFDAAKELEKQQIIEAHGIKRTRGEIQGISFWESKTGEQYYEQL